MTKFKDLSAWLKIAAIAAWAYGGLFALAVLIGFLGLY